MADERGWRNRASDTPTLMIDGIGSVWCAEESQPTTPPYGLSLSHGDSRLSDGRITIGGRHCSYRSDIIRHCPLTNNNDVYATPHKDQECVTTRLRLQHSESGIGGSRLVILHGVSLVGRKRNIYFRERRLQLSGHLRLMIHSFPPVKDTRRCKH
jgi:hypothetical protein